MNGIKYLLDTNIIIGMYQRHVHVLEIVHTKRIAINEAHTAQSLEWSY